MSEQKLVLKNNEIRDVEIVNFDALNIELNEGSKLSLKLINFEAANDVKISAKVKKNASFEVIFADFSNSNVNVKSLVDLVEEGASCDWKLATLSNSNFSKRFDVSFTHHVGHTIASMDNYGVARGKSEIVFSGINHIKEHAKQSTTKQNAKIIVFDKEARGTASPILKIDENDVVASHGAIVGQLNEDHMFYLMSRGLNKEEARELITLGYLKPISVHFSEKVQIEIENAIKEVM